MAKRPPNRGASWTFAELRTLKQLAKADSARVVAKKLGRTAAAVQQKAMRAGISFRAKRASGLMSGTHGSGSGRNTVSKSARKK